MKNIKAIKSKENPNLREIIPFPGEDLMELARRCNAVYICPKEGSTRKGPLVVYAGKDSKGRNLVGDIYFNFRKIEVHPKAIEAFARSAFEKLRDQNLLDSFDTVCGIPQGGRTFGQMLALIAGKKFAYADKVPKPTGVGKKQEYTWDLSQFDFEQGERVAIAEDVFNNFQNTDNTLNEFASLGVNIALLVGALNRSVIYDMTYTPKSGFLAGKILPVVASIRKPYPEYDQDNPAILEDVLAGNIEFNVKRNWQHLLKVMGSINSRMN